jgi:dipeptidyl aminopeptidase/acylaminoacyl peptidase
MPKQRRAYGSWDSPIAPRMVASGLRLFDVQWSAPAPDDASLTEEALLWVESRAGTGVLVVQIGSDAPRDVTESDMGVRGRIGYAGGEFTARGTKVVFAGNEGRLYVQSLLGGAPRPITPAFGACASPKISPDGRWVLFVHHDGVHDGVALVDIEGAHWPRKLAFGDDFVTQPVWHPAGTHIAYIAWNRPQMPWDGAELRLAALSQDSQGFPIAATMNTIAGGVDIAAFQPEFSPDGRQLAYASDETGWWQLYVYDLEMGARRQLTTAPAEHAQPNWVQGMRTFAWSADGRALYCLRSAEGVVSVWRIEADGTGETRLDALNGYTHLRQIAAAPWSGQLALLGSSSSISERVLTVDGAAVRVRRRTTTESVVPEALSKPQAITWAGHDGEPVYGLFYPPESTSFESTGQPPLIVYVHGGPTSQVPLRYEPELQFYATRGFAVLAVNYRGSTGYGKAYKDKLRGAWGIYDVEDCASGAQYLADRGLVHPNQRVILGGSAGGFTVLQSLVTKPGFYSAGVCLYGVANQFTLVTDSHFKFETHYSETLLGPLPEAAAIYRERSPVFFADRIRDPLIVFQGDQDNVVPKAQSDGIVAALRARGVPHEYHVFEGEGHGWRKPETIEAYLTAALKFIESHVLYA